MSSTTVASRAYAVVPAKRSRWSRGGAYRPRSAPAAGSARHRADAGRRDRAARSPDPQPASCRRSFRRGYRARAAPSTRHHWRPRPDRQPVPGCVGRDVLAGACVPTSGPAGAVPVRVRSRSSAGLRWRRGRLWHPRRQHRPLRTGPGSGDRCEGRRFAPLARRIYVPGILSSQPPQVCPPAHGTVPERRANVQKGARPRGTDRRYSVPFRGSAGRRNDAGTRWLGCCPPEMSTGETHPRAKRPMNRAKTPLRRRAAPLDAAAQSGFINIHLLVSPEDPDHVRELGRILSRLTFSAFQDGFACTRDDLIRLGTRANPNIQDERAALRKGATQFKVNFNELREVFGQNAWAKRNVLIAVVGGSGDGTSGLRDGADATVRQEIEGFAHVIFSSNRAQREFWLGQRSVTAAELHARYGGLKPCLHGSDAHSVNAVGGPQEDRFSWVKGGVEFDSLRQACIDPAGRVYVGPKPPTTTMPSQVISSMAVEDADWFGIDKIPMNSGLVTIIGARGSGKTALAEMIVTGCDGVPAVVWDSDAPPTSSFLTRARSHLGEGRVRLVWGGGDEVSRYLDGRDSGGPTSFPRLRYLSQQFVEDL